MKAPMPALSLRVKRSLGYLGLAASCLASCVVIVTWFGRYPLVRGLLGDVIIVMLLYFLLRSVHDFEPKRLAVSVLAIAVLAETAQYLDAVDMLGFEENRLTRIVFGSVFDYRDLLAYPAGASLAYLVDARILTRRTARGIDDAPE